VLLVKNIASSVIGVPFFPDHFALTVLIQHKNQILMETVIHQQVIFSNKNDK
jgi:hypothetical protein